MSYEVKVKIEGVSPLMQHRFSQEEDIAEPRTATSGEIDYSKEYEKALYRDEKGEIYQPAAHIEGAIVRAAGDFKVKGKRGKSYKEVAKAAIVVEPFAIPHLVQKFVIDQRRVRVQKAAVMRSRPRFDRWGLEFRIIVGDDQLALDVLQCIVEHAGKYYGIGDYRPKYGRFRIVEFKKVA